MSAIAIYCKGCNAMFYASSLVLVEDVLDIVKYAKQGHHVAVVDAAMVRMELAACSCRKQVEEQVNADLLEACRQFLRAERLADEHGIDSSVVGNALIDASNLARAAIAKAEK